MKAIFSTVLKFKIGVMGKGRNSAKSNEDVKMQQQMMTRKAIDSMKILLLVFLLGVANVVRSQDFAINNERQNIFFRFEENPITIVVNNCPCRNIKVTAGAAEVVKLTNSPCRYNIIPDQIGKTVVTLFRKSDGKVIGSEEYRVLPQRVCLALAGKCGHGKVKKNYLVSNVAMIEVVNSDGADYDPGLTIQQFTVSVERSNNVIFNQKILGSSLSLEAKRFFEGLKQGDIIKFDQIICKWRDGKIRGAIESAEFEVIE